MVKRARCGPKSYLSKAAKPRGLGLRGQLFHLFNTEIKDDTTRQSNRCGFFAMWKFAESTMVKFKVKRPGEFRKNNIHGGKMWGSMQEWRENRLSEDQIFQIVLDCYKGGATESILKTIRKTCSYLYNMETGVPGENYPAMKGVFKCIKSGNCTPSRGGVRPLRVPTAKELQHAFTKEYSPDCGLTFLVFLIGLVVAWDFFVLGSRPNVDLNKIKKSTVHMEDKVNKIVATKFIGGRSKLTGNKKGHRNWWAYRVCMCPNGQHISPSKGLPFSFDRYGNSSRDLSKFCTCCPVFAFEVLQASQPQETKLYRQWLTSESRTRKGRSRWGDMSFQHPQVLAIRWMNAQGVPELSKNSGRMACAKWSEAAGVPFSELVHVVGDNPDVWRKHYSPNMPETNCKIREQSLDPVIATAALRRFARFCGRGPPPEPPPQGLNRHEIGMWTLLRNSGYHGDAKRIFG